VTGTWIGKAVWAMDEGKRQSRLPGEKTGTLENSLGAERTWDASFQRAKTPGLSRRTHRQIYEALGTRISKLRLYLGGSEERRSRKSGLEKALKGFLGRQRSSSGVIHSKQSSRRRTEHRLPDKTEKRSETFPIRGAVRQGNPDRLGHRQARRRERRMQ